MNIVKVVTRALFGGTNIKVSVKEPPSVRRRFEKPGVTVKRSVKKGGGNK